MLEFYKMRYVLMKLSIILLISMTMVIPLMMGMLESVKTKSSVFFCSKEYKKS